MHMHVCDREREEGRHIHLVWFQTAVVQAVEVTSWNAHYRHTPPPSLAVTAATSLLLQCFLIPHCLIQDILK